jgi:hypothetical protein
MGHKQCPQIFNDQQQQQEKGTRVPKKKIPEQLFSAQLPLAQHRMKYGRLMLLVILIVAPTCSIKPPFGL